MAIIPNTAIVSFQDIRPSSFFIYALLCCQVKGRDLPDVSLPEYLAIKHGLTKTSYYTGFKELEEKRWIEFSRKMKRRRYWKLLKGFEENYKSEVKQTE